ncbi:ATP-binding protein [Sphingomonas sp. 28-62-20]|uniref:ATP-binding protein n=1 Tax=Sphingomonas sp. 28-62-20 TaxID=1970433 RepID=UPI00269870FD
MNWRTRLRQRWLLSTQLATVLAVSVLICAAIIITETQIYEVYEQTRVMELLSPEARKAVVAFEAGRVPEPNQFRAIMKDQEKIQQGVIDRSNIALFIFTVTAALGAFLVGAFLLRRVGGGLNDVAAAARAVAEGRLDARAGSVRFASIEEDQLTQDFNAMAEALQHADRELKDSTAAIAHELRTPLTVLSGRLHGIQDGVFAAGPDQIDSLIHQVDSLTRLVDDLRTMSLVNSGQLVLDLATIDLAEAIRPVIAAMRPDLEAAGLTIICDLVPAPMIGDAGRLRQALAAVLSNAIRYAPGSGPLWIESGFAAGMVQLRVIDSGTDLTDEAAARAFERFWRGDRSRARSSGGSGLGLSVVRAIAAAHGGSVSLTRRPTGGAVFEMLLPPVQGVGA